jgi:putative DNA primase/helicase
MTTQNLITDKKQFKQTAKSFFKIMFGEAFERDCGQIEILGFMNGPQHQSYHNTIDDAVNTAYNLCQAGLDVYFGVNPRVGGAGKKENVHWLTAFHAELDYGKDGHKKVSEYATYEEALEAIRRYRIQPTIVIHSGGGFHCYWILISPVNVKKIGVKSLENVNRAFTAKLKGDSVHNVNRILRIPGTLNLKLPDNPREVTVVFDGGPTYEIDDFKPLLNFGEKSKTKPKTTTANIQPAESLPTEWDQKISNLPVSDKIKNLIINGNDGTYTSRSEADMAVIVALVNKGVSESDIRSIFENYAIGEKYREHNAPDNYLKHNIEKAKEFSNLTEEERQDPLFISGALHKSDSGKYHLKIVPFQEYMNKKHMLKFLEKERAFFRYSSKCYEQCSEDRLNNLCQTELSDHRELFTPGNKANFIHFAIGNDLVDAEKAFEDQVRYLTMQNGLYDLLNQKLILHTSKIFTTNLLPYDHDPDAQCPRWFQYLDEVFLSDADKIKFVQEAVGYAFHKSIPKPALFFLIGDGGNGKSVFIDIISSLCGKENVCNVSLNKLNDEKYLLELFGKMVNVSDETPNKRCMNTDLVKAVVDGAWVTGREIYKKPSKFQPYAKHYLGMNTLPEIDDNTHGMWRRIYVIEFPRKFTEREMDVELSDKLKSELSGIFNWALEGYKRLRNRRFIFSESASMQRIKKQYKSQNNSVLDFAEHCLGSADPEKSVVYGEAYKRYEAFCANEGQKPLKKKEFGDALKREGYLIENSKRHANQVRIFGVKYEEIVAV